MADRTRLELATSGVTGRHSNPRNYRSKAVKTLEIWWVVTGSNRRPSACKADALPAELTTPDVRTRIIEILVGWSIPASVKVGKKQILKAFDFSSKIYCTVPSETPCIRSAPDTPTPFHLMSTKTWKYTRSFILRRPTDSRTSPKDINVRDCTVTPFR